MSRLSSTQTIIRALRICTPHPCWRGGRVTVSEMPCVCAPKAVARGESQPTRASHTCHTHALSYACSQLFKTSRSQPLPSQKLMSLKRRWSFPVAIPSRRRLGGLETRTWAARPGGMEVLASYDEDLAVFMVESRVVSHRHEERLLWSPSKSVPGTSQSHSRFLGGPGPWRLGGQPVLFLECVTVSL